MLRDILIKLGIDAHEDREEIIASSVGGNRAGFFYSSLTEERESFRHRLKRYALTLAIASVCSSFAYDGYHGYGPGEGIRQNLFSIEKKVIDITGINPEEVIGDIYNGLRNVLDSIYDIRKGTIFYKDAPRI